MQTESWVASSSRHRELAPNEVPNRLYVSTSASRGSPGRQAKTARPERADKRGLGKGQPFPNPLRLAGLAIYTQQCAAFLRPDLLRLRCGTPEAPGRDGRSRGEHVRLLLRPAGFLVRPDVLFANRRGR